MLSGVGLAACDRADGVEASLPRTDPFLFRALAQVGTFDSSALRSAGQSSLRVTGENCGRDPERAGRLTRQLFSPN
jgi:hypothetical protein